MAFGRDWSTNTERNDELLMSWVIVVGKETECLFEMPQTPLWWGIWFGYPVIS
jgi:hypothetical protein